MDCAEIHIPYSSRADCIKLVFLGDAHLGNVNTDEILLAQVAKRIEEPNVYWFDLGDACEFINMRDPRFDPAQLPAWIGVGDLSDLARVQVARYGEIFSPVGNKCLARLTGNHEETLSLHFERDVYSELNAAVLGAPIDGFEFTGSRTPGFSGFVRLRVVRRVGTRCSRDSGTWTLTVFLHHGAGGGQLAGAKVLRLERLPLAFDADIYAMGHTHTKLSMHKRRLGLEPRRLRIVDCQQVMLNVGGFARSERSGYAEVRGLYPQDIGPIEVWLWPDERQMRVVS